MAWVYILISSSQRYYIGSTDDLERRLVQHISGQTPSTKRLGLPMQMVAQKFFPTLSEARRMEQKLKRWKNSKKAIEYLKP